MVTTIVHYLFFGLFFFIPLVMNSHTSEIFEFNKMMLIYAGAVVIGAIWVMSYVLERRPWVYKPYFLLVLLTFLITQMISAYFSIDPHTSVFGYYGRWNGGIVSIIAYTVLFFVFVQVFTKKLLDRFLLVNLASSAIVILWGLLAKIGFDFSCLLFTGSLTNTCWTDQFRPAERMFATLGQPNWLGAYLCVMFFIGLYFFVKEYIRDKWNSIPIYGFGAYLVLNILSIYFTKSRSALLAFGIAIALGIVLFVARRFKPFYTAVALVMVSIILFFFNPQNIVSQLHSPSPDDLNVTESFDIRKIVWQGAIELGLRYPYFGTGVETFAYSYYFTRPTEHNRTSEWDFIYNKAHNEYLNYFATTGFVGLGGYLLIIVTTSGIFYLLYKKNMGKDDAALLSASPLYLFLAYITILVTNFFGFSTSTTQLFFYIIPAALLISAGMSRDKDEDHRIPSTELTLVSKSILALTAVVGIWGLGYVRNYYLADMMYSEAKNYMATSDYGNAMIHLHDALKLRNEHVYEDKLSGVLAYLAFQYSFDDKARSKDFAELAKFSNYKALSEAPYNMLYWKTQSRNNYLFYQISHDEKDMKQAVESMEKALMLAPTDVQTMYALAVLYVTAGQEAKDEKVGEIWKEKARTTLQHIFELKPDYREAQQLGGQV